MQWIRSQGGPLILVSEDLVQSWRGSSPVVDSGVANLDKVNVSRSDYDRACDVKDYVGLIDVGNGQGLVLGDEPLQTGWLPSRDEEGGMFVRWRYADDEASVLQCLTRIPDNSFQPTGIDYYTSRSTLLLFDAAIPGHSLRECDYLLIRLLPSIYNIQTAHFAYEERTALILHRLLLPRKGR